LKTWQANQEEIGNARSLTAAKRVNYQKTTFLGSVEKTKATARILFLTMTTEKNIFSIVRARENAPGKTVGYYPTEA
jgi:hypothetical protein